MQRLLVWEMQVGYRVAERRGCRVLSFAGQCIVTGAGSIGRRRFWRPMRVDNHSRESMTIEVGQRLTGDDVVRVME